MGNLTNKYIKDTYDGLIKLADEYNGVTPDLQSLQDGLGNDLPIKVSQTEVVITGSLAGNATSSDTSVSASHAVQADSASYVLGLNVDGPVLESVNSVSASYSVTASYAENVPPQSDIYVSGATFNILTGDLALQRSQGESDVVVDMDGRYVTLTQGQSADIRLDFLEFTSASLNAFTSSQEIINSEFVNDISGLSSQTGSYLITGSVAGNTITLTKQDGSTFPLTVDTGSVINTTYDLNSSQSGTDVDVNLVGSDATTDTVKLVAGANITLTDNGLNNITIDAADAPPSETSLRVINTAKNVSGSPIAKGTPCYITGSGTNGNLVGVFPADAGNPSRMPAGVVLNADLDPGEEGESIVVGFINGVDTSLFLPGDSIYVAVGGGYTNVKPTGSALIQKLGNVEKSDAIAGSGLITGPNRTNDVPNIQEGYIWVGNGDQVATPTSTGSFARRDEVNVFTQNQELSGSLGVEGLTTLNGGLRDTETWLFGVETPIIKVEGLVESGNPINFNQLAIEGYNGSYSNFVYEMWDSLSYNYGADFRVSPVGIASSTVTTAGNSAIFSVGASNTNGTTSATLNAQTISIGGTSPSTDTIYLGYRFNNPDGTTNIGNNTINVGNTSTTSLTLRSTDTQVTGPINFQNSAAFNNNINLNAGVTNIFANNTDWYLSAGNYFGISTDGGDIGFYPSNGGTTNLNNNTAVYGQFNINTDINAFGNIQLNSGVTNINTNNVDYYVSPGNYFGITTDGNDIAFYPTNGGKTQLNFATEVNGQMNVNATPNFYNGIKDYENYPLGGQSDIFTVQNQPTPYISGIGPMAYSHFGMQDYYKGWIFEQWDSAAYNEGSDFGIGSNGFVSYVSTPTSAGGFSFAASPSTGLILANINPGSTGTVNVGGGNINIGRSSLSDNIYIGSTFNNPSSVLNLGNNNISVGNTNTENVTINGSITNINSNNINVGGEMVFNNSPFVTPPLNIYPTMGIKTDTLFAFGNTLTSNGQSGSRIDLDTDETFNNCSLYFGTSWAGSNDKGFQVFNNGFAEMNINVDRCNMNTVMRLQEQDPLPAGSSGEMAVSGSALYFHDGATWNLIS